METILMNDTTNHTTEAYLRVNHAGHGVDWGKKSYTVYRPEGRVDWHILLVNIGYIRAIYDGEETILHEGDFVIYAPGEPQRYTFPGGETLRTYYVHFTGTVADEIMRSLSLTTGFHRASPSPTLIRAFEHLASCGDESAADKAEQNGALLKLLGMIARETSSAESKVLRSVRPALARMRNDFSGDIPMEDYAALCEMSVGRFQHAFREALGMPPHRYLTQMRVEKAKDLLAHTDLTVAEVAYMTGFRDPLYFSRVFRRETGVPPTEYRE